MARQNDSGSPTDRNNPCDVCGGGTYTFASGSQWCPAEDPHPGGHFVKRVAFEPSPRKTGVLPLPYPKSEAPRAPKVITPKPEPQPVGFDMGMDSFVRSDT
jgi:hypothetical protein